MNRKAIQFKKIDEIFREIPTDSEDDEDVSENEDEIDFDYDVSHPRRPIDIDSDEEDEGESDGDGDATSSHDQNTNQVRTTEYHNSMVRTSRHGCDSGVAWVQNWRKEDEVAFETAHFRLAAAEALIMY